MTTKPLLSALVHMVQGITLSVTVYCLFMKIMIAIRGRSKGEWHMASHFQNLEVRGKMSSSLTSVAKDNLILEGYEAT